MRDLDTFHDRGNGALANGALHGQAGHGDTAGKLVTQPLEHRLQDGWHAGKHMNIAKDEARRGAERIVDQGGTFGNVGHLLARRVELDIRILVMRNQPCLRLGVPDHLPAKGGGDTFGGDVIMRRPDAAAGKDKVMCRRQQLHSVDNDFTNIRDHPRLTQHDALLAELLCQPSNIPVLGTAGQDFITDDDYCGCRIGHACFL